MNLIGAALTGLSGGTFNADVNVGGNTAVQFGQGGPSVQTNFGNSGIGVSVDSQGPHLDFQGPFGMDYRTGEGTRYDFHI